MFWTDKFRKLRLIACVFWAFSNFRWVDFHGRIKDLPSAQEPLGVENISKLSKLSLTSTCVDKRQHALTNIDTR